MENYSLSDIAAASGNEGFGGNSWVLIILFALIFGMGGNGGFFGGRGDYGAFATSASQQEILFGQQFQGLDNKIDRIGNGIADATFALNNTITGEGRGIQMQLANCCCENQKNVDALRYELSNAIHGEGEQTRALLQQNKIETLQSQINQLQLNQALCGVVRYPMSTAYNAGGNPFCGGGCNCGGF